MDTSNIIDYIYWRGDITVLQSGLSEVDGLILCMLSFIDFAGIVPEKASDGSVVLSGALDEFFKKHPEKNINLGTIISGEIVTMAKKLIGSRRFESMHIAAYKNLLNAENEEQFCAMTVFPGDGTRYLIFRGTGDNLVGWKENFNMAFMSPVPSQADALEYLCEAALSGPEPIRLAGHSKGGNMAVYAAAYAPRETQARILEVYSYDGPGFQEDVIESDGYKAIEGRVRTLVPQSSVVGMLLEHGENYEVVKSSQFGLVQHDGFSWEVLGTKFINLDEVSGSSRFIDKSLNCWVKGLDKQRREEFVDALFSIFESAQIETMADLSEEKLKKLNAIVKSYRDLDKETRSIMSETIRLLVKEGKNTLTEMLWRGREKGRSTTGSDTRGN